MRKKIFIALALILLLPAGASAATFLTDEDTVHQSAPSEGDVFAAGNTVLLNQAITGDVFAAGQQVETSGAVSQDVFAAGNTVTVRGDVGDDVFAAGNTVTIAAPRASDIFAAGNTVTVREGTTATGDAYLAGASVAVAGTIEGDVRIASDNITIENTARINGNVTTYGQEEPTIAEGAAIAGEVAHHRAEVRPEAPRQAQLLNWLRSVATWFVIALLALYALPHITRNVSLAARERMGISLLVGIAWLLLFAPVAIILMATIIGLPLGFALLALSIVLLIAAYAYGQIILGELLARRLFTTANLWQQALLGVVVFKALQLLPLIGGVATFFLLIWALGALVLAATSELRRPTAAPKAV